MFAETFRQDLRIGLRVLVKDKGFAAKVERDEVHKGCELLGVELAAHVAFVIEALRPHAAELGLLGRPATKPG